MVWCWICWCFCCCMFFLSFYCSAWVSKSIIMIIILVIMLMIIITSPLLPCSRHISTSHLSLCSCLSFVSSSFTFILFFLSSHSPKKKGWLLFYSSDECMYVLYVHNISFDSFFLKNDFVLPQPTQETGDDDDDNPKKKSEKAMAILLFCWEKKFFFGWMRMMIIL